MKLKRIKTVAVCLTLPLLLPLFVFAASQTTSGALASAIITQARFYLNEPSEVRWDNDALLQWVNDGTMDIVARSHCLEAVETEVLVENQLAYALADSFIAIRTVVYDKGTGDEKGLLRGNLQSLGHVEEAGEPIYWFQDQNNVVIYPSPDSTGVAPGSEKVTDGAFAASGDWTWGAAWAHDAVNLEGDATTSSADLEQDVSAVSGETYVLVWTLTNYDAGSVLVQVGGEDGTARSSNDTYTEYITASGGGNLKFQGTGFTGTIDDVSVKKVATLDVYTISRPTAIAASAAVQVPAHYDKALVYYVVAQAWGAVGKFQTASAFLTQYYGEIDRYRADFNVVPKEPMGIIK